MEEITLWAPEDNQRDGRVPNERRSRDGIIPEPADHKRLSQIYMEGLAERHRISFTARGRRRRQDAYETVMKRLAKGAAVEVSQPVEERKARTEVRIRTYALMMELITAATKDHEALVRRSRAARRNSLILTLTALVALGLIAASRGW